METQELKMHNHSGNNGHGGVHLCHKCGWPFPNPHPSSRLRRAHKKICGTIDGFRLDDAAQGLTHVEADVGEQNCEDDDHKTIGVNVVEKTISRGSSSITGSKSSGSIRSDEDVYMDAASEIGEKVGTITRLASDGVMQRFYSMESGYEIGNNGLDEEIPAAAGNLRTPDLLENNEQQTDQRMKNDNKKLKADVGPRDNTSVAVSSERVNVSDQNMIKPSGQPQKLDTVSEESASKNNETVLGTLQSETPEKVAEEVLIPKGACDELKVATDDTLNFTPADGLMKTTLMDTDVVGDNNKRFTANISRTEIDKDLKSDKSDEEKDKTILDSVDSVADHLQEGSLLKPQPGREVKSTGEDAPRVDCSDENGTPAILIVDDNLNLTSKSDVHEDVELSCQSSAVVSHCPNGRVDEQTSCICKSDGVLTHQVTIPAIDAIVDSGSQTGSLDGNWGSLSAMSATSDAKPTTDSNNHRPSQGEESLKPVMEYQPLLNQTSDKIEAATEQMEPVSDIQTPTVAHVDRGNKGKEIIDNVANRDLRKERTPLKALLGEAFAKSRAESPVHETNLDPGTENTILKASQHGIETEAAQEEMENELNSPTQLPIDSKAEKRRPKNKSYWMPFFCCSSVNANGMAVQQTKR